ncbi:MAG: branched-chain amino acid ABC transporter permease [bacterium]
MAALLAAVGFGQSWSLALAILNLCLISAIMALGVNIQWGYAGLFNVGVMGFAALGGVAPVLISNAPVPGAWDAGGVGLLLAFACVVATIVVAAQLRRRLRAGKPRLLCIAATIALGYLATRHFYAPAVAAIEAVNPAKHGYLGGLGLPIGFAWLAGGLLAAAAAWAVGKVALGLRSDYLAIATLGISEIIIAFLKNEDWLTRGVKNVTGLARPVPYEIDLQRTPWFIDWVARLNRADLAHLDDAARTNALAQSVIDYSSLFVKLCYAGLFAAVLAVLLVLAAAALNSPWGRMMRAIRDNEVSAGAMGKNVTARHLQVFILGSAVVGVAGAMLTTLDGQFTPGTYHPLRFTFLIWVMVIVGGSGNNLGAVLGGFLIWFLWVEAEPAGLWLVDNATAWLGDHHPARVHLMESAQHMRLFLMGLVLLLVMRFSPTGILPEVARRSASNARA